MRALSRREIRKMRRAGAAAARTRDGACALVRPGLTTEAIDRFVAADTRARGGRCAQHGYRSGPHVFPGHVCVSPNAVVCHGVPSPDVVLADGDIVNIDVTTELEGWHGDTSRTVFVGTPSAEARHVVEVAERAMWAGIEAVRPGAPLAVIGRTIQALVEAEGCSVVRDYTGHGIGRSMHEPPSVWHVDPGRDGPRLQVGHCFTIEPMVNLGGYQLRDDPDGWTVWTADGSLSAQFEHTIVVTPDGAEVLTRA